MYSERKWIGGFLEWEGGKRWGERNTMGHKETFLW